MPPGHRPRAPLSHGERRVRRTRPSGPINRRLVAVARDLRQPDVTVGAAFDRLGPEGLGLALLLLTLPTLLPIPGPIGMTFGTLIALVAGQMLLGGRRLWLPSALRTRPVPAGLIRKSIAAALPWFARVEGALREQRLSAFAGPRAQALLGVPVMAMGLALVLPIPLGNVAPATAVIVLALGLMARDGLAIAVALVLCAVALAWTGFLVIAGASVLDWLMGFAGF